MKRSICKILSLVLIMAMSFTLIAAAASGNPPLGTAPVYKTLSDGTIYTRVYSGYTNEFVDIDRAMSVSGATNLIMPLISAPWSVVQGVATYILSEMRKKSIDHDAIEIECYKYIETRQKPGDISPVYTTLYYMTYHFSGNGISTQVLSYEAMSPYSLPTSEM